MFGWLKARQRRKLLAEPFPASWQEVVHERIWQYRRLSVAERDRLHNCIKVIVAEKNWEGCNGLSVTEEMTVTIAGHASLMLLGASDYFFDGVRTVLIYPQAFGRRRAGDGLNDTELRGGEAWQYGPIVLSWDSVTMADEFSPSAHNVVIHEFSHHLDGLDGEMGGTPIFDNSDDQQEWAAVMNREFADLRVAASRGQRIVLDHYGASSEAEFFAVASESFFEKPSLLQKTHPELYELLRRFYQIDPLEWVA